jgi:hypothetical protein
VREVVETSLHSDGAPRFELTCDDTTGPQIRARRYHTIGGIHCGEHLTPRVLRLSKACSKILRHEGGGICGKDGFAPLDMVLRSLRRFSANRSDVENMVRVSLHRDTTPRFEMQERKSNGTWIRARRNHTIPGIRVV